jgi:heme-degrading monooxygenase HmoA
VKELPGFLGLFDLANGEIGQAVMVTFWATQEARAASAEYVRSVNEKVVEETDGQVLSVREYELGALQTQRRPNEKGLIPLRAARRPARRPPI